MINRCQIFVSLRFYVALFTILVVKKSRLPLTPFEQLNLEVIKKTTLRNLKAPPDVYTYEATIDIIFFYSVKKRNCAHRATRFVDELKICVLA